MIASPLRKILLVEDEELYREAICDYLQRIGYDCTTAGSAQEAMETLGKDRFDLILSDIRMEGLSGLDLLRKAREKDPFLNFIIMTGHPDEYTYSEIIDSGASDFIAKPFQFGELKAKLERIAREKDVLLALRNLNDALSRESGINSSLAELSKALLISVPIEAIAESVLVRAKNFTASPFGYGGYIDQGTGFLVSTTLEGGPNNRGGAQGAFRELSRLWGWVLDNRRPLLLNAPDDRILAEINLEEPSIQRFLSVPALIGDSLIGQLAVANSDRDYTEDDLSLMERLATIYALAVQRKWTEEQLSKTRDQLELLVAERTEKLSRAGKLLRKSIENLGQLRSDSQE
jgi:CheY-like chemotaxis protein